MASEYIIMVRRSRMPSSCFGGCSYYKIGLLEVVKGARPKMISKRAKGVVRVIRVWDRLFRGKTTNCVFSKTHKEACDLRDELEKNPVNQLKFDDGTYRAFSEYGSYPLVYYTKDGGALCAKCASSDGQIDNPHDPQWHLITGDVHYEGKPITCEHCGEGIDSAYGVPDEQEHWSL